MIWRVNEIGRNPRWRYSSRKVLQNTCGDSINRRHGGRKTWLNLNENLKVLLRKSCTVRRSLNVANVDDLI